MRWYQATGQALTMKQQVRAAVAAMARLGDGVKVRRVAGPPETEAGVPVGVTSREWPTPPEGARFGPGERVGELHVPGFSVEGVSRRPDRDRPEIYSSTIDGGMVRQVIPTFTDDGGDFVPHDSVDLGRHIGILGRDGVEEHEYTDIYFSAGPTSVPDYLESGFGCNWQATGTCSVYRVRWSFTARRPLAVEKVLPNDEAGGYYHPSLSPSGGMLAAMYSRVEDDLGNQQKTVVALDFGTNDVWTHSQARIQHPHWHDESSILLNFDSSSSSASALLRVWKRVSGEVLVAHPKAEALDDPVTHQGPPSVVDGVSRESGGRPLVALMFTEMGAPTVIPRVFSIDGAVEEAFVTVDDEIPLANPEETMAPGVTRATLAGCHHPSWNPGGTAITCSHQQDPSIPHPDAGRDGAEGQRIAVARFHHRLEYQFEPVAGATGIRWMNVGRTFEPLLPEELAANFPPFAGLEYAWDRYQYTYKYSEWCADDDWVITTLFVEDVTIQVERFEGQWYKNVPASRVFLVDKINGTWWDLTFLAEQGDGRTEGTYQGVYQTCSSRRSGRLSNTYLGEVRSYQRE